MQMFLTSQHLKYSRVKPSWTSVGSGWTAQAGEQKQKKNPTAVAPKHLGCLHWIENLHHVFQHCYRRKTGSEQRKGKKKMREGARWMGISDRGQEERDRRPRFLFQVITSHYLPGVYTKRLQTYVEEDCKPVSTDLFLLPICCGKHRQTQAKK